MRALDGVQVLDFGRYVAGPYCAQLLGQLGARVIRVERPGGAEDRGLTPVADDAGSMFLATNIGKESITLDTRTPGGRLVLHKLVAASDVVVANLPPRGLAALGLTLDELRRIRQDIILTTVTAFGADSDWADRPGFDGIGQAMSGAAHLTGEPDTPLRAGVSWVDFGSATLAALGTMAALRERDVTGEGQQVDAALLRTALAFSSPALIEQAVLQNDRQATANRGPQAAPSDIFRTRDGWIIVYAVGDAMFRRWAALIGEEEKWTTDPRLSDDARRGEHGEEISARMSRWTARLTTAEALDRLTAARLPAAPVYSPQQALDDESLMSVARMAPLSYPTAPRPVPSFPLPLWLSGSDKAEQPRPPRLGEHTSGILAELGFGPDEITDLAAGGAI
ncbi:CoA transferase [Streptomyces sp. NPDC046909]|uniref:CaiB/BaiF CoA transferase family protein n=1 Tax=Streptomyces sp. NPDC046909 TaxID=3155617 RepID=UPI0033FFCA34